MADRRLPYARTIKVLRILSWPSRYPPLSWVVAYIDWVAAKNARLITMTIISAAIVAWAVIARG